MRKEKLFLSKLNLLLVQIVKNDWPSGWPEFIPEIVGSSRASLSICENNLNILRLLSEEIFDFASEGMTTSKAKRMKTQLCNEFSEIFRLCLEILEKSNKSTLLIVTLDALSKFLKWIPLGYIFETPLLEVLLKKFLALSEFKTRVLNCLAEICSLAGSEQYENRIIQIFTAVLVSLNESLPYAPEMDLAFAFEKCSAEEGLFLKTLTIFINAALTNHLLLIEKSGDFSDLIKYHLYLLKITCVNDQEIFKICLEYWNYLASGLYNEYPYSSLNISSFINNVSSSGTRRSKYSAILSSLREVLITKMTKPEEILIVEDENGEIVREKIKEVDSLVLYKMIREILIFLTHLDCEDTERIILEKLSKQVDGSEWSWSNLNKLCWAVGSISGSMNEEIEERFLVTIIRDLLGMVEIKKGKDNKAVIASNIMYIVGQYPRFLKAHWKFLKTVVNKLFEFMHERHEGVQDMACDTLQKVFSKCKKHFITLQPGEIKVFIEEILENLQNIICDLNSQQICQVYQSIGYSIAVHPDAETQETYLNALMQIPNSSWNSVFEALSSNHNLINDTELLRTLCNIIKTNSAVCKSVGSPFIHQLSKIYLDMLSLYRTVSSSISNFSKNASSVSSNYSNVKSMRHLKKEILNLIDTFVLELKKPDLFTDEYISYLFESILVDYQANLPNAREPFVLKVTSSVITVFGPRVSVYCLSIFESIFECTLNMINQDFSQYPEHRIEFFGLLKSITIHCFNMLLHLPEHLFKLYIDSITWAFKHSHREVSDIGLEICSIVLSKIIDSNIDLRNKFFGTFMIQLIHDILYVLTDSDHRSGFNIIIFRVFWPMYDSCTTFFCIIKGFNFDFI